MAQNPPPPPAEPLLPPIDPVGNASNPDKVLLGKTLFWDEQLSSTKTVACATCHIVSVGGVDPRASFNNPDAQHPGADGTFQTADDITASPGVSESCEKGNYVHNETFLYKSQVTGRTAPSVINVGYSPTLFWDGRADDQLIDPITQELVLASGAALENQVLGPMLSSSEMAHTGRNWEDVVETVKYASPMALSPSLPVDMESWIGQNTYRQLFELSFGEPEITASKIAMAIASYERSLFANQSPFDENIGGNPNALNAQERRGLNVFRDARCGGCHVGSLFSDNDFHNTGVVPNNEDEGRYAVTGVNADMGRFKTPPLRNLEPRSSFMHNGAFATLEEVVDFYDRGGDFANPNLDPRMVPLNLTQGEKDDLVVFLKAPLTDERVVNGTGPFSSPLLYSESDRVPLVTSSGVAGSGSKVPAITANQPPVLGNDNFTVAIENALANHYSVFVIGLQDPGTSQLPDAQDNLIFAPLTLSATAENDGHGSLAVSLPGAADMEGQILYARWYVEDDQAANGYAISPLVEFSLFSPEYGLSEKVFGGTFENIQISCD